MENIGMPLVLSVALVVGVGIASLEAAISDTLRRRKEAAELAGRQREAQPLLDAMMADAFRLHAETLRTPLPDTGKTERE